MLTIFFVLSIIVISLDQWLKLWTVANLGIGESQNVIEHFFSLNYVQNTGAAWSILEGETTFLQSLQLLPLLLLFT